MKDEKLLKLKEFLLDNSTVISGTIKVNSKDKCCQQSVSMGRGNGAVILNLGDCKIEQYQAVNIDLTNLEKIYYSLKKIFE